MKDKLSIIPKELGEITPLEIEPTQIAVKGDLQAQSMNEEASGQVER
jgi:hypothetical protein